MTNAAIGEHVKARRMHQGWWMARWTAQRKGQRHRHLGSPRSQQTGRAQAGERSEHTSGHRGRGRCDT